jgi:hypothetical protein
MEAAAGLAARLSRVSSRKIYDVYTRFEWPESLEGEHCFLSPELVSLHGTEVYAGLDEEARRRLGFFELVGFFSFVLHGEQPLLEGVSHRLHARGTPDDVTEYMHHFLDEENKHMVMFRTFCRRYAGKVYPEKKIPFAKEWAPGEEDVAFFVKVLVVEELGEYYNVALARDPRVHPLVREINLVHHIDEARHIAFGRAWLRELWERHSKQWSPETLAGFRGWVGEFLRASWRDFYNPSVYRDAGVPDPFAARRIALESPVCRRHREVVSKSLLGFLLQAGILEAVPAL